MTGELWGRERITTVKGDNDQGAGSSEVDCDSGTNAEQTQTIMS